MSAATAPIRHAPPALWAVARAFLETLHGLFGAPEQVAEQHTLTLKAHQLMASWLRCGEAMLRRLLLIEAGAFAKPNLRPLLRPARKRERKPMGFTADAPEKWRVSFRCFDRAAPGPRKPRVRPAKDISPALPGEPVFIFREDRTPPDRNSKPVSGRARRPRQRVPRKRLLRQDRIWVERKPPPPAFRSAWPLAERYEALLRVFNDPTPYARRLSRRLHATPHRAAELARAPPEAEHRIDNFAAFLPAAPRSPPSDDTS